MDFLTKFIRSKTHSPSNPQKVVAKIPDKQPSLQKLNGSLSELEVREHLEETSDGLKENFNPKPLSEIAADKTPKLKTPASENNQTSTPKITKTVFSSQESDCDPDCTIDLTPRYQREPPTGNQQDISLGFLTEGFNKLDLGLHNSQNVGDVQNNSTFSDDEEQFVECQSFADLSNRNSLNSSDVLMKTFGGNVTITKESGQGDVNGTFDAGLQSLNSTHSAGNGTFNAGTQNLSSTEPAVNGTFDAGLQNLSSTETAGNGTFNSGTQDSEVNGTFNAETQNSDSAETAADITFDHVEPRVSTESSENFGSCSPSSKSAEDAAQRDTDFPEQELPQNHELPEDSPCTPKAEPEQDGNVTPVLQDEDNSPLPEADKTIEVIPTESQAELEIPIDEVTTVESVPQETPAPEAEEYFHNIDEFSKSQSNATADRVESTFSPESMKQEVEENPFSPASKVAENFFCVSVQNQFEVEFKKPAVPVFKASSAETFADDEFNCGSSYSFADSDFDYLQKVGSSKAVRQSLFQRDSLLLKFDPLCAQHPTPALSAGPLTATTEEDDFIADLELKLPKQELPPSAESSANNSISPNASLHDQSSRQLPPAEDESMSVEIMKDISVENKTSESDHIQVEETKLSSHNYEENHLKMAELENKIKKEAEIREEALLKRISEKDKQISKMNGVVEAYEKAISELIAEKEQLVQSYEKKCNDLKYDSEQNAHHLTSLETTFSDLHSKYERTKQIATELKDREEHIVHDRKTLTDNLKMQEARYEKMKSHAMSQLEIANSTLADLSRNHQAEVTKLKALLKKEEVSRASVNEQLIQKAKENSELVKICDELINGTQSS